MKKLKLTAEEKKALLKEFEQSLDGYDATEDKELSFVKKLEEPAKEKIHIIFTPLAYLRCSELVRAFSGEVGLNGLVENLSENKYLVYDIMVYPQVVNGARTVDPTKTNDWYEKYEDVLEKMRFQAHSHVNMSTTASTTDMENQKQTVRNVESGIRIFQIWNKSGDINTFVYDLDKDLLYDRKDVVVDVLGDDSYNYLTDFMADAKKQAEDMKIVPLQTAKTGTYQSSQNSGTSTAYGYHWNPPVEWQAKTEAEKMKDPFYWKDGNGSEGWT